MEARARRRKIGQTLAEYALIIALIAVAVISAMIAFKGGVEQNFGNSNSELQKAFNGR